MSNYYNRQWRLPNAWNGTESNVNKQSNYSMDFDGTQLVSQGVGNFTSFNGVSECSVSLWFKSSTSGQGPYKWIFNVPANTTGNHGFGIYPQGTGLVFHSYTSTSSPNLTDVNVDFGGNQWDGNWHHLVLTYKNGVGLRGYYDSVLQFTDTSATGTITAGGEELAIGGFSTDYPTGNNIIAQIDGVSAFTYALSQSQVTTLYGSSSTGIGNPMTLNPVAYYPLGDQDSFNGAEYLVPNSSLKDYVFNFYSPNVINTGNSLTITRDLTLSGWVNFNATNTYSNTITSKHISSSSTPYFTYQLYIENNGAKFRIGTTTYTIITGTTTTLNDGKWHHILGTYDGSNINLYVDGVSDATAVSASGDLNTAVKDTTIGAVINGGTGSISSGTIFLGELSNIQIFNTALPATGSNSIETLYNNGSPLTSMSGYTSLQGWWKLDASATYDSSTTTWDVPDDSTNSNTGTSSGMTQANLVQSDLSFTSSYSPYALNFDGTDDNINAGNDSSLQFQPTTDSFTFSAWIKIDSLTGTNISNFMSNRQWNTSPYKGYNFGVRENGSGDYVLENTLYDGTANNRFQSVSSLSLNTWYNVVWTYDYTESSVANKHKIYLNKVSQTLTALAASTLSSFTYASNFRIGAVGSSGSDIAGFFDGKISNVSVWDTALTSTQVSEIYNEGVPSNLNNHSAYSNLVSWWQLGSNTSWVDPYWIALDEKGTNNGESQNVAAPNNMGENAIVDGVGSYANGLSSGMGGDEVIGDAPYSTANSLSVNMDVLDRTDDTPS